MVCFVFLGFRVLEQEMPVEYAISERLFPRPGSSGPEASSLQIVATLGLSVCK